MLPQVVHQFDRCATLGRYTAWKRARHGLVRMLAPALMLLLSVTVATAQTPRLKNIFLCNGEDRTTPDPQIKGCTALIDAGGENVKTLASAYNNRGDAYIAKGEYDLAINDFDQSIKLNPESARTFNNRGFAYKKKGEYDRAMQDFEEGIKLNPMSAGTFANRAGIYEQKGEYVRAAQDYDEAIRLAPSVETAWKGRCWNRAIIGELD